MCILYIFCFTVAISQIRLKTKPNHDSVFFKRLVHSNIHSLIFFSLNIRITYWIENNCEEQFPSLYTFVKFFWTTRIFLVENCMSKKTACLSRKNLNRNERLEEEVGERAQSSHWPCYNVVNEIIGAVEESNAPNMVG